MAYGKESSWLSQNEAPAGVTSVGEPACCGTCVAWQDPWALQKTAEDRDSSAK